MDPPKINFWGAYAKALVFFDISKYLEDNVFYIIWGTNPTKLLQMDLSKNHF